MPLKLSDNIIINFNPQLFFLTPKTIYEEKILWVGGKMSLQCSHIMSKYMFSELWHVGGKNHVTI